MADYTHRVRSPGRVNLVGGHTDYAGGRVLPVATDLHTHLDATPTDDGSVTVRSAAIGETGQFAVDAGPAGDWTDYVRGCLAVLRGAGHDPGGFTGEVTGDLPLGAGLSSSASLELAVLSFLNDAGGLGLPRETLARLGQRVENEFVGVPCGILDQFAVACGRAGHAIRLDTSTREYAHVPVPDDARVVVLQTGVERSLDDTPYACRRETVEAALDALGADSVHDVAERDLDALSARQRERLGYVVREHERVARAGDALAAGDLGAFGDLLIAAHRDVADAYGASCPELDFLVDAAVEHGAYGARLTGAGWGGAAVAVVDADRADTVARAVSGAYAEQFPDRAGGWHVVAPADGVRVERVG